MRLPTRKDQKDFPSSQTKEILGLLSGSGASLRRPDVLPSSSPLPCAVVELCVRLVSLRASTNSCSVAGEIKRGTAGDDGSELLEPLFRYTPSPNMVSFYAQSRTIKEESNHTKISTFSQYEVVVR
eukprot:GHVS01062167.1.p1 GENE.GHVS01062167.1~~GHVS01062167.1.p1  ORF type:complete len:126 (-),score=15.28 GHVS01062167.1:142-519(-)